MRLWTAPLLLGLLAVVVAANAAATAHALSAAGQHAGLGVAVLVASLAVLGAGWVVVTRVANPLTCPAGCRGAMARGGRVAAIPGPGRTDEFGAMVQDATAAQPLRRCTDSEAADMDLIVLAEQIARAVDGAAGAVRAVEGRILGVTRELHGSAEAAEAMTRATRDAHESVAALRDLLGQVARSADKDADRRATARVPLRRGAMLELAGRRAVAVNLLDLSEGGAAIETGDINAEAGLEGALVFGTSLLPMRIVAVGQGRIHLAFTTLSAEARATIRHMISGAGQALAA